MAVNQQQFAVALLRRLGIDPRHGAVRSLVGWENAEGGNWHNSARFNPLNTTLRRPGSTVMGGGNSAGVQAYRNWHQGLRATAMTLRNYPGIERALRSNHPMRVANAIGSSSWGTSPGLVRSAISSTHLGGVPRHLPRVLRSAGGPGQGQAGMTVPGASGGVPVGSTGLLPLIQQLTSAPVRSIGGGGLTPPSFAAGPRTPAGYQAPQGGAVAQTKPAIDALLKAIQTPGQDTAGVGGVSFPVPQSAAEAGGQAAVGGAAQAIKYAYKHLGVRETGTNSGPYISGLEHRFGFSNAPWCAMFTSAAVTHGGAPASARTASVQQVRAKARAHQGYEGFVGNNRGRAGDLILWGNDHIGMIVGRTHGGYVMIAGNDSNAVSKRVVAFGSGYTDIVRPAYGHRR